MTNLSSTMIPATDFEQMISFYKNIGSLEITDQNDDFAILKNPKTQETICVTNGHSMVSPGAGFRTDDIIKAIENIQNQGGKIQKIVATCLDPEGNELMVVQGFDKGSDLNS